MKLNKTLKIVLGFAAFLTICCLGLLVVSLFVPDSQEDTPVAVAIADTATPTATDTPAPTETSTPKQLPPTWTPTIAPTRILETFSCIPDGEIQIGTVTKIIDGDTIQVEIDGQIYPLRYIGIDTLEANDPNPLAAAATEKNGELVMGKSVILVKDVSNVDRFDRLLRYVVVDDIFVNYELVKSGLAIAKAYAPDTACHNTFVAAQDQAKASMLGIWVPTPTIPPAQIQPTQAPGGCPNGCTSSSPGCAIKGNISSSGEKIFHVPGQRDYEKTVISPGQGERWFCTEAEAIANGWRKAKR